MSLRHLLKLLNKTGYVRQVNVVAVFNFDNIYKFVPLVLTSIQDAKPNFERIERAVLVQ